MAISAGAVTRASKTADQRADKPVGPLSDAEVAYWLRQFMPGEEPIACDGASDGVAARLRRRSPGDRRW